MANTKAEVLWSAGDQYIATGEVAGCDHFCADRKTTLQELAERLVIPFYIIGILNPQYAEEKLKVRVGECINVPIGSLPRGYIGIISSPHSLSLLKPYDSFKLADI